MVKIRYISLFTVYCALLTLMIGCAKQGRLTGSTLILYISPNSATINTGATQTFTVYGRSAKKDNVDVNPTWYLDPSGLGTLSTTKGKSTTFTAGQSPGTGKIYAVEGDVRGEATITVTPIGDGPRLIFNVYNDAGISGNDVWTWSDRGLGSFNANYSDPTAPEGTKSFETKTNAGRWAGWGVAHFTPIDLSAYSGGVMKFWVKSPATIKIEIQDGNNVKYARYTTHYGYRNTNEWSELTIPLSDFGPVPLNNIKLPFMATIGTSGTFYIDNVRWVR